MSRRKESKAKARRASKARAAQAARHNAIQARTMATAEKSKSRMRRAFSAKALREGLLTFGAIAGVLCMLLAAASFAFDVRPVIFRSGSMSPAIDTGALALSHTVKADDLKVGDIVTVKTDAGIRVTHRVQSVTLAKGKATLLLKGDANKEADDHAYVVGSADRVLFDVPRLGYVVSWLSGPIGIFAGGLLAGLLVLTAFGPGTRNQSKPGTRRLFGVSAAAAAIGIVASGVAGPADTQAYYSDTATLTSGTFSRAAAVTITECTTGGNSLTITWTAPVSPTTWEFRYAYSPSGTEVDSFSGTLRTRTSSTNLNNKAGTVTLVGIFPDGPKPSFTYAFQGNGSNRTCTLVP